MHKTAMDFGALFFRTYLNGEATIVDVGSQDVNGSLRRVAPVGCRYIGLDFTAGPGVDVLLSDPYDLQLEAATADAVVCSSCMEHSEFFWLTFLEMLRVVKPGGLIYLNVPSNGPFHRYPVDCWRFYPDAGPALARWGQRNGFDTVLLESFTGRQNGGLWNDFVAVFVLGAEHADRYPGRMSEGIGDAMNGLLPGREEGFRNLSATPEDKEPRLARELASVAKRGLRKARRIVHL